MSDLRRDDSIIITRPDKGNGVVIASRLDYLNKMKKLISDGTKFKQLEHNPTKSREESLSAYLRKIKKDGIIVDVTFHKILPSGSSPGVLYGLPKVHKAGCPFRICLDRLYSLPDPPQLPRSVLKDLLQFATKKSHFIFDGQYYDQIDGVAMGSPLGPVLANIFMCHFEEKWLMNSRSCPSLWFRYVDDAFTMFDSKDNANEFLSFLNSRHDSIKFTLEFEEDNKIPFLDILLKRCPDPPTGSRISRARV